jgi:hypothetical protein
MATLKQILKSYFSAGRKPEQEHFHEWMDSYIHKTEDGLTVNETGNLGVGIPDPKARLHVNGGLKIGHVPDDASPDDIPMGTLRWTGTELQIYFANAWSKVWPPDQETAPAIEYVRESYTDFNLQFRNKNEPGFTPVIATPNKAKNIVHIAFFLKGMQYLQKTDRRTSGGGGFTGNLTQRTIETVTVRHDSLTVIMLGNNNQIWKNTSVIKAKEGVNDRVVYETSLGDGIPLDQLRNVSFQFIVTSEMYTLVRTKRAIDPTWEETRTEQTRLDTPITVSKIDITYAVERGNA